MIDLGLFRRPAFSLALGANTLAFAVVFGIEVFVAQYFQLVLGYSPLEAGLWSVPGAVAFVVGSQLTPPLAARIRPAAVMLGGIAVAISGVVLLTQVGATDGPAPARGGRRGPVARRRAAVHTGRRPRRRERTAGASGRRLRDLGDELGTRRGPRSRDPRNRRRGRLPRSSRWRASRPSSPPRRGRRRAIRSPARSRWPTGFPQKLAADVLEPAREAFTHALQVAATLSGVLVIAAAILVAMLLVRDRDARAPELALPSTLAVDAPCA